MVTDARSNTTVWIKTYYTPANAVDDDGNALGMECMYDGPNYSMTREFKEPSVVDAIITVGTPETRILNVGVEYEESVPISIHCVDKTGVTGTKAMWQVENELRTIAKDHFSGSLRSFDRISSTTENLGSLTKYSVTLILRYVRYA